MRKPKPVVISAWKTVARIILCAAIIALMFVEHVCISMYVERVTTRLAEEKEKSTTSSLIVRKKGFATLTVR